MKKQITTNKQLLLRQTNFIPKNGLWMFLLGIFTLATASTSLAQSKPDTVVIDFGDSSKVTIQVQNQKDAQEIRDIDWNLIMEKTAVYLENAHQNSDGENTEGKPSVDNQNQQNEISDNEDVYEVKDNSKTRTIIIGTSGIRIERDDDEKRRKRFWTRTRHQIPIDFGLNNYFENGNFGEIPSGKPYELRTWGSRYFAIGTSFKTQIGGRKSPLILQYGLEASWNNFMFSGDNYALETENGVSFPEYESSLDKSKLTAAYINLPIMVHLDFADNDRKGLKLAFGGYAGYRVGGYTKIVYHEDGDRQKDKEHSNFRLNDWRYGVRAEVGVGEGKFDSGLRLFFNYDLNTLFRENSNLPELNAFSFGIRL
ncbi:outer membrane beta-barrel protein [Bernardetia sp.]|uniref:outer membrane beta-barrel protein n=1 Tax=Bernardetia sp. TaxID=1937974 RepID=UPI0025B86C40|nr:outer membrane beta-barrel protein [Bernardetia sp.]